MDFKIGIGSLSCRLCAASFQMPIHHLNEPIDVFSEWLDDCEAAQQGKATGDDAQQPQYESSEEEDDDLPEASGLQQKKKAAAAANPKPSYSALGLDDSDDDSDDD